MPNVSSIIYMGGVLGGGGGLGACRKPLQAHDLEAGARSPISSSIWRGRRGKTWNSQGRNGSARGAVKGMGRGKMEPNGEMETLTTPLFPSGEGGGIPPTQASMACSMHATPTLPGWGSV